MSSYYDDLDNGSRIVGGQDTTINKHPHQVALLKGGGLICGGSIIKSNRILTAAHCVDNIRQPSQLSVRAGSTNHKNGGQIVVVEKIIIHPQYDKKKVNNDIAILVLKGSLKLGATVVLMRLPNQGEQVPDGAKGIVTGWGAIRENTRPVDGLRMAEIPVVANAKCNALPEYKGHITANMMCAGYLNGNRDSCDGDSGGPYVISCTQVGIVSFGLLNVCGRPNMPGVYTRVSQYRTWINNNI